MFKRANKVTALLVAAASVMSLVPAMASTRLGTKEGHITDGAVAFADGKYMYEGYRTSDTDTGIYYNNGTDEKEKFTEDLRDYSIGTKYGTKYVYTADNKDQYLVDLTTGKIVDDETPEDKADTIKSKLKSALKKTERYSATGTWDSVQLGDSAETENYNDQTRLFPNQFGDILYRYWAKGDTNASDRVQGHVADYASFTMKLPTTGTNSFKVKENAGVPVFVSVGQTVNGKVIVTLDDLKAAVLYTVQNDPTVTAVFNGTKVDSTGATVTSIAMNADKTAITGFAANKGEIAKDNTALAAFATAYGVTLKGGNTQQELSANEDLNLGTITGATSSNASVATTRTSSDAVTLIGVNAGKAVITVKDSLLHTAAVGVSVTTDGSITVDYTKKYVSEAAKAESLTLVANSGTLTAATTADLSVAFTNLGLTDLVNVDPSVTTDRTKLTIEDLRAAILHYIQYGTVAGNYVVDANNIPTIAQKAYDLKIATQQATETVSVYRGASDVSGSLEVSDYYTGYVNESGKYIDASSLANVFVYSEVEGKTVKIKEYNKENTDYKITVGLQNLQTLAQDKDYIYALATVDVLEKGAARGDVLRTDYFIQKISKAQGDTKDDAYLPKSVESYQIDNKSIFDNGDSSDAYAMLVTGTNGDNYVKQNVSVKDGVLYVTGVRPDNSDKDSVKVFKVVLKKDKNDLVSGVATGKKDGKDVDVYIAKKDDDKDLDLRDGSMDTAVTYDVNGNTWAISKGSIYKFDGVTLKEMYTCDRSFTHLDVYDDNNLIAWDKDTDVYTTVQEGTKVTQGESTAVAPVIVTGWVKGTDGTWTFNDATGAKVVSKWQNIAGVWYFLKADGIMATGWYNDNGTWYYLNGSGAMQTGWLNDNGTWYYLAGSGAMLANTTVDGYVLGASGAWVK